MIKYIAFFAIVFGFVIAAPEAVVLKASAFHHCCGWHPLARMHARAEARRAARHCCGCEGPSPLPGPTPPPPHPWPWQKDAPEVENKDKATAVPTPEPVDGPQPVGSAVPANVD